MPFSTVIPAYPSVIRATGIGTYLGAARRLASPTPPDAPKFRAYRDGTTWCCANAKELQLPEFEVCAWACSCAIHGVQCPFKAVLLPAASPRLAGILDFG